MARDESTDNVACTPYFVRLGVLEGVVVYSNETPIRLFLSHAYEVVAFAIVTTLQCNTD